MTFRNSNAPKIVRKNEVAVFILENHYCLLNYMPQHTWPLSIGENNCSRSRKLLARL
jgi:hypothetical protein